MKRALLAAVLLAAVVASLRGTAGAEDPRPAGPVHLVHDFFPGEFAGERPLPQLTRLGDTLFFVASDLESGKNVWRTDGTAAGSHRVPIAGAVGPLDEIQIVGTVGGRIFWTAVDSSGKSHLLAAGERGDATVLGTSAPDPKILGRRLYFAGCTASGCGVTSTDGTAAGTAPVAALAGRSTGPVLLASFAGRWLVLGDGPALLAYDAERDRVLPLLSIPARIDVYPVGDNLFVLTHERRRERLWVSRLSAPRASQIFGAERIGVGGWRDGRLYFAGPDGRLWSTDGTRAGTRRYAGERVEDFSLVADQLGAIGSTTLVPMPGYYWGALLAADETRHELREILPVCSGKYGCLSLRMSGVVLAGERAFEEVDGRLIRSDGTAAGTGFGTGLRKADAESFGVLDGHLFLGATRGGVQDLWRTDGTAAGTQALTGATRDRPFRVQGPPIAYGDALFAAADRNPLGQQLWRVADGRATPVTDLRHLASGLSPFWALPFGGHIAVRSSESYDGIAVAEGGGAEPIPGLDDDDCLEVLFEPCPDPAVALRDRLLFGRRNPRVELWSTDGTTAGTLPVNGPDGAALEVAALGRLVDRALILTPGGGLWSTDGSPSDGAHWIAQLPFGESWDRDRYRPVGPPVAAGSVTYLFRRAPAEPDPADTALELWRTDGTAPGTLRLLTTPFSQDFSSFLSPAVVGGRLFFRFGGKLWTSDGSPEGTSPLRDPPSGGTFALMAGTGTLYAAAGYQDAGDQHDTLWAIDPATLAATPLGTFPQIGSGAVGTTIGSVLGDTLFFAVSKVGGEGEAVWVTEGTAASTRPLPEPLAHVEAKRFFTAGDRRYFTACETEHGCELWSTDRVGGDLRLAADFWPGPRSGDPEVLAADGSSILFAATEPTAGRELWRLDPAELPRRAAAAAPAKLSPPAARRPLPRRANGRTH